MVPHASKSILVVEDDRDIRETLASLLSDDGYEVSACSNGLEALKHLRAGGHADVILLDLMMPVVDGWEFRVEQKQDRRFASIPVVALSADGTAKAAAIDADGYLHKPVEYAQLVETIERTVLAAERRNLQAILVETERQVFLNLVLNAAQAIPAGDPAHNEIRLTARAEDRDVIVEVTDTGAGIAPEIHGKILEPFFTTKPLGVGTGLGLSISHRIVDAIGGQLTVANEPGRGSTFRVRLPIIERPARVASPPVAAQGIARRVRILVIDDDPTIATSLVRILGQRHDVEAETNPEEALGRFVRGERFDLVLCDLVMPGRSGMDVHAALARLSPEQAERMIFVTGGVAIPAAEQLVTARHDRVTYKPFPVDELVARISAALALFAHRATS